MSSRFVVDEFGPEEWNRIVASFPSANVYQTWDYGELHSEGALRSASRAVLLHGDRPVAAAQFRVKRLPLLGTGVAEANWGPLWRCGEGEDAARHLAAFLESVARTYGAERRLDVRFEPRARVDDDGADGVGQVLEGEGFLRDGGAREYRTVLLDLAAGPDALRKGLHQKWRYHLKRAEKSTLEVEYGDGLELFDRFHALYRQMWEQKRFETGVRVPVIRRMQAEAPDGFRFLVGIATNAGQDVGATVSFAAGDTMLYFLGATSPNCAKGLRPGYLLHWHNVLHGIDAGLKWYDAGGLSDRPDSQVDHFKLRMRGTRLHYPGWYERPSGGSRSEVYAWVESTYRRMRRVLTRR